MVSRIKKYLLLGLLVLAATLAGILQHAKAMSVVPLVVEMQESGSASSAVLKIYNDRSQHLPVELTVKRFELTEKGKPVQESARGELTVFPPQALIPPGATQTVKVVWTRPEPLDQSRSYFIDVNQVPVKMPSDTNGWRMVTDLRVIANVAPVGAKAKLSLLKSDVTAAGNADYISRRDETSKNKSLVSISVSNTGNRHARISEGELRLKADDWSQTLSSNELYDILGLGLVQPGKRRTFTFQVDVPANAGATIADYRQR